MCCRSSLHRLQSPTACAWLCSQRQERRTSPRGPIMSTHLSSATAIALSNPDLLFALFEHLALFSHADLLKPGDISSQHFPRESYLRRQTLINAALTCRSFAEPASSVLWRVLYPGPHPIFYPFPGFHKTTGVLESPDIDDAEQLYISPIPNHVSTRDSEPGQTLIY